MPQPISSAVALQLRSLRRVSILMVTVWPIGHKGENRLRWDGVSVPFVFV